MKIAALLLALATLGSVNAQVAFPPAIPPDPSATTAAADTAFLAGGGGAPASSPPEQARFLSGLRLPAGSVLEPLQHSPEYLDHTRAYATAWKKFDQEQADPAWSEPTTQQIEQTLDQWLAGLPEDVRQHIAVIHVECRATMCQILAADNDIDTQNERAQAGQEWQQALASLPGQPWWNELGFVDASTQVTANEGHTLYMTYLRREVKPASP